MNTDFSTETYFEESGAWPEKTNMLLAYCAGFILSIFFTLAAYFVATHTSLIVSLSFPVVVTILIVLACAQFVSQLIFFFHLGHVSHDRLIMLICTLCIIGILVAGSLWIMGTLSQRMIPTSAQMNAYMNSQQGI